LEADEAPSPGTRSGLPTSLLCGDIRAEQGASIVRRPVGEKVIADNDKESE
jgi:hypothetical protein